LRVIFRPVLQEDGLILLLPMSLTYWIGTRGGDRVQKEGERKKENLAGDASHGRPLVISPYFPKDAD